MRKPWPARREEAGMWMLAAVFDAWHCNGNDHGSGHDDDGIRRISIC